MSDKPREWKRVVCIQYLDDDGNGRAEYFGIKEYVSGEYIQKAVPEAHLIEKSAYDGQAKVFQRLAIDQEIEISKLRDDLDVAIEAQKQSKILIKSALEILERLKK